MAEKKTRKVKLYAKWRELQTSRPGGKSVPWLNVSGVWLEQAGFHVGDQVTITVEQNQLIIKPYEHE
uniref:Toxin SymE-like domain-containing protein n=1 Tax=Sphingobacterium sp. (strain 21) TaxID=743722 RepID=F4C8X7_SPHS2